ncbi:MAG: A24 family peptidase [Propionibacteriaceae bacterium]|nr:A24 family peptidase [Propionibacteriaceae bacterium]
MFVTWSIWAPAAVVLTLLQALWLVPRLSEPEDGAELHKVPYARLPTRGRLVLLSLIALATQVATATQPASQRGLWLVLGSSVLVLIWVDALTTWLPTVLARLCLVQMVLAAAIGAPFADHPGTTLLRVGLGAAASWGLWWLIWRLSRGGIGYGDVRLAPLLGAAVGACGVNAWLAALLAGSLAGVIWALARRHRPPAPGTTSGFAYGPALWIGPYAALIWMWALGPH